MLLSHGAAMLTGCVERGICPLPLPSSSAAAKAAAGKSNSAPPGTVPGNLTAAAANSSHVEDATYFELNNITVGYNLKDVTKFMKNLRVYVSAQRPIMITGYEGIDPVSRWTDYGDPLAQGIERRETYFRARTFTLGLNITL